jgi:vesicle coat complex subunit
MEEKTSAKYADSQSHKTHRAVSQKIQKRREAEKKRKKEKKIKESKGKRNKEKRTKKLDKYISKLVRTAGDSWPEILSVFEALDEGAEVGSALTL